MVWVVRGFETQGGRRRPETMIKNQHSPEQIQLARAVANLEQILRLGNDPVTILNKGNRRGWAYELSNRIKAVEAILKANPGLSVGDDWSVHENGQPVPDEPNFWGDRATA